MLSGLLIAQIASQVLVFLASMTLPIAAKSTGWAPELSTVPNTVMLMAAIAGSFVVGFLRQRTSWRVIYLGVGVAAMMAGWLATEALHHTYFWMLVAAAFLYGTVSGAAMWLRYTRTDFQRPKAATFMALMQGSGLVAAVAAPAVVALGAAAPGAGGLWIAHAAAGAMGLFICAASLLLPRQSALPSPAATTAKPAAWALLAPAAAAAAASFFAMGSMMAGTPREMSACGFGLGQIAEVYRGHLMAMFLPSLLMLPISGRVKPLPLMATALCVHAIGAAIGASGATDQHFLWSMVLSGAGWSLAMVGTSTVIGELSRHRVTAGWPARFNTICILSNAAGALYAGAFGARAGWSMTLIGSLSVLLLTALLLPWLRARESVPAVVSS